MLMEQKELKQGFQLFKNEFLDQSTKYGSKYADSIIHLSLQTGKPFEIQALKVYTVFICNLYIYI